MSANFVNEHWLIDGIGWVHVLGNKRRGFDVSEPERNDLPRQERFRLALVACDVVNGTVERRVLAKARLKDGCQWEACV